MTDATTNKNALLGRARPRLQTLWAALVVGVLLLSVVFPVGGREESRPWALGLVAFPIAGAIILAHRPRHGVGRLMTGIGIVAAAIFGGSWYATSFEGPTSMATEALVSGLGFALFGLLVGLLYVFPDGRPPTASWRPVLFVMAGWMALFTVLSAIQPGSMPVTGRTNPWGISAPWLPSLVDAGSAGIALFAALGVVSLASRWKRADDEERLQLKWFVAGSGLLLALLIITGLVSEPVDGTAAELIDFVIVVAGFWALPAAIFLAVLRYRLYDIDLVINRSVLFLLLAGFIIAVYAVIVAGIGALVSSQASLALSVAATAVVALAFEPVRARAQRWANRVAYGDRATPYEVLSDLIRTLADAESASGLLDRTARRLAEGTGAERATVWIVDGDALRPIGTWPPPDDVAISGEWGELPGHVTPVVVENHALGALTVEKDRGDPITPTERRLIEDLAGSSGSVLRNLALQEELSRRAEELAASRKRLMEVQDMERRRMERDLDEGAQQLVVSLKVKLNVAARLARVEGADSLAGMLETMDQEAREAISQIRSLARGLYPPLLEAAGLDAALRSVADQAPVPVDVEGGVGRLPPEVEAALFFCVTEAITNAAKHAPGEPVRVHLARGEGAVTFEVLDQGPGFDPVSAGTGSGLRNMADRIDAVGGRLEIVSAPGRGTRIKGNIPVTMPESADSTLLEPAARQGVGI